MGLDFELGQTADLLRESVAEFAAREISPLAGKIDQENAFPAEL